MSQRLFVGNLALAVTDQILRELFREFGNVLAAEVVPGRAGRSRRYAYVELENEQAASDAIAKLNGHELHGRAITVALARSRGRTVVDTDWRESIRRDGYRGGRRWNRP